MSDRDSTSSTPDPVPDDAGDQPKIPREPSKRELDAAAGAGDAPEAPELDAAEPETLPPNRWGVIMLAILAALMLVLGGIGLTQDPQKILDGLNPTQIEVTAAALKSADVRDYSNDEIAEVKKVWKDRGENTDPSSQDLADAFNQGAPPDEGEELTADEVKKALDKANVNLSITLEDIKSLIRNQLFVYFGAGILAALGAFLYHRGKEIGRYIGMFVAGVVTVMYVMQLTGGSLNVFAIAIALTAGAAFYFLMKGRLRPRPAGPAMGSFFRPRGPKTDEG